MQPISLSINQLATWLAQKGLEIREPFWGILESNCENNSSFEHEFIIDDGSFPGIIKLLVLFVERRKLLEHGWSVSEQSDNEPEATIYITSLLMNISPREIQSTRTRDLGSYFSNPALGIRIEQPRLVDLNLAWSSLVGMSTKLESLTSSLAKELGIQLIKMQTYCM